VFFQQTQNITQVHIKTQNKVEVTTVYLKATVKTKVEQEKKNQWFKIKF
jgi:hypothetical protein